MAVTMYIGKHSVRLSPCHEAVMCCSSGASASHLYS
jgi:hypothetical protein